MMLSSGKKCFTWAGYISSICSCFYMQTAITPLTMTSAKLAIRFAINFVPIFDQCWWRWDTTFDERHPLKRCLPISFRVPRRTSDIILVGIAYVRHLYSFHACISVIVFTKYIMSIKVLTNTGDFSQSSANFQKIRWRNPQIGLCRSCADIEILVHI